MQDHTARRKLAIKIREIFDLIVMGACFFLATYGSYSDIGCLSFSDCLSMRIKVINFITFALFLFLWHCLFVLFGLYQSKRLSGARREIFDVLKATSAGSVALFALGLLFRIALVTPHFIVIFWAASTVITVTSRFAVRYLLKALRLRGRNSRRLLIVGTNQRAVEYAKKIESRPDLGYRVVGFVENGWSGNKAFRRSGYSIVTDFEKLPDFIRTHVVDEVIVCLPMKSLYEKSSEIVRLCEEQGIIARFLSDFFNLEKARSRAETLDGDSVITIYTGAMRGGPLLVKRGIDVLVSLILLLLLSPVFAVTAILIKLTSPGSVFFIQERVGLNKRTFRLYKFRTMIAGAEKMMTQLEHLNELSGPVFKIKNDPRITWIGKYLRKTSMDELPQLINVLKGEISLVGPRPLPVRDYEGFDEDWQRRRFSVRPGVTCLWQVNGRNAIPFEKWMEMDMEYIDNWSLGLDLKILARTIPAVLRGSGAA
jgi:exopolysaccharide biosynthesis polyprenyl glycosylphosphotransferase